MRGSSPILITAALSVAALIAAFGAHIGAAHAPSAYAAATAPTPLPAYEPITDSDGDGVPDWEEELAAAGISLSTPASTTTPVDTDPLSHIAQTVAQQLFGGYLSLKQYGSYTPQEGQKLGATVAENIAAEPLVTKVSKSDLTLSSDVSEKAALRYRASMRDALQPLVTSDDPEITLVGKYVATKDPQWLRALHTASLRYSNAARNLHGVVVPQDAGDAHVRALNALLTYSDTVERLSKYGSDSLALFALLKTLDQNEAEMVASFDALARYYVAHITNN